MIRAFSPIPLFAAAVLAFHGASTQAAEAEAFAKAVASPEALITAIYKPYLAESETAALPFYTDAEATGDSKTAFLAEPLKSAVAKLHAAQKKQEDLYVDYDVFVDGQDYEIKDLKISAPEKAETAKGEAEAVTVKVTFTNFGESRSYEFRVVKPESATHWYLADGECKTGYEKRGFTISKEVESVASQAK